MGKSPDLDKKHHREAHTSFALAGRGRLAFDSTRNGVWTEGDGEGSRGLALWWSRVPGPAAVTPRGLAKKMTFHKYVIRDAQERWAGLP